MKNIRCRKAAKVKIIMKQWNTSKDWLSIYWSIDLAVSVKAFYLRCTKKGLNEVQY